MSFIKLTKIDEIEGSSINTDSSFSSIKLILLVVVATGPEV